MTVNIVINFETSLFEPKPWLVDENNRAYIPRFQELEQQECQTQKQRDEKKEKKKKLAKELLDKNIEAAHNVPFIAELISFYGKSKLILTTNDSFWQCRGYVENISHITKALVSPKESRFQDLAQDLDRVRYTIFDTSISQDGCRLSEDDKNYLPSMMNVYDLIPQNTIYITGHLKTFYKAAALGMTAIHPSSDNPLEKLEQAYQSIKQPTFAKVYGENLSLVG